MKNLLLQEYFEEKLDLSAFGVERSDEESCYFCTPLGARIIGWAGVDGIHYCTIDSLGDTVFAVSPMNDPRDYVVPVAEDFEAFLRLLLACGHEAYLSQAYAWSQEQYLDFALENPPSDEAEAQAAYLQKQFGIAPAEDPYLALKVLYDRFDPTTVPYGPDYYEWVPEESRPQPRTWEVYFSLHQKQGNEKAGAELPLDVRFCWGGYQFHAPAAYLCSRGLVLDLLAEADSEQVDEFFSRWMTESMSEEGLTPEQGERLIAENPLNLDFRATLLLNGKLLGQAAARGNVWDGAYQMHHSEEMRHILDHYGADMEKCWIFRRISFPWVTKTKPTPKCISLRLTQEPKRRSGDHFFVSRVGQQIELTHPVTGEPHTLTVVDYEQDTLPITTTDGYEHPSHLTKMTFTLSPDLPARTISVSDTRQSDAPRKAETAAPLDDFASAIALIGGADGPTAVCIGAPQDSRRLHTACSALTFTPQEQVEWIIHVYHKTETDGEFVLLTPKDK